MPKIIEDEEEEEFNEEDEEDEEEEEEEAQIKKAIKGPAKRPMVPQKPSPSRAGLPPSQQPKRMPRYAILPSAVQTAKIVDSETGEIIGEGEYALMQGMANIIERLERIENTLGSMIERP